MFIGHLPAGYLGLVITSPHTPWAKPIIAATLLGSIAPDLDMLWFTFIDSTIHHHHLITHRPFTWILTLLLGLTFRSKLICAFAIGALLHCTLDTIAGSVMWLWPINDAAFHLVTVQATHSHWALSFLNHWTFKVEIALTLLATIIFILRRNRFNRTS
ncbi:MAG: metal-dependent hydrolase [Planktomarina sp.]